MRQLIRFGEQKSSSIFNNCQNRNLRTVISQQNLPQINSQVQQQLKSNKLIPQQQNYNFRQFFNKTLDQKNLFKDGLEYNKLSESTKKQAISSETFSYQFKSDSLKQSADLQQKLINQWQKFSNLVDIKSTQIVEFQQKKLKFTNNNFILENKFISDGMNHYLRAQDALKIKNTSGIGIIPPHQVLQQARAFSTNANPNVGKTCTICHFPHTIVGGDPCQYLPIFEKHMNITDKNVPNFFDLFDMKPPKYQIETRKLWLLYTKYQSFLHPDKFAASPNQKLKEQSAYLSVYISEGYNVLKDPIKRAVYYLKVIAGVDALPEDLNIDVKGPNELQASLITDVFDIRESLEEVDSMEKFLQIEKNVEANFAKNLSKLELILSGEIDQLKGEKAEEAVNQIITCQYWNKILEEVKEKGWHFEQQKSLQNKEQQKINEILNYWYPPAGWDRHTSASKEALKLHFSSNPEVDQYLTENYGQLYEDLESNKLEHWKNDQNGRLAYVLLCDQFSRNIFRKSPKAFAFDERAQKFVKTLLDQDPNFMKKCKRQEFIQYILVMMHSENKDDQKMSVKMYEDMVQWAQDDGLQDLAESYKGGVKFAKDHQAVIEKFGRYPGRNKALGRESSKEEIEYLQKEQTWGQ